MIKSGATEDCVDRTLVIIFINHNNLDPPNRLIRIGNSIAKAHVKGKTPDNMTDSNFMKLTIPNTDGSSMVMDTSTYVVKHTSNRKWVTFVVEM